MNTDLNIGGIRGRACCWSSGDLVALLVRVLLVFLRFALVVLLVLVLVSVSESVISVLFPHSFSPYRRFTVCQILVCYSGLSKVTLLCAVSHFFEHSNITQHQVALSSE